MGKEDQTLSHVDATGRGDLAPTPPIDNTAEPRVIPINRFADVILFALEWKRKDVKVDSKFLTFSEIWTICDAAGHRMKNPIRPTPMDRKEFAKRVFDDIEFLQSLGFVWRYPEFHGSKLLHIGLTPKGMHWLDHVIFSGQENLNRLQWPTWLGGEKRPATDDRGRK